MNITNTLKYLIIIFFMAFILPACNNSLRQQESLCNSLDSTLWFKNGDRVCFVGNSITHEGHYHKYISLFYYTRFPSRHISFSNAGIGGDQASGALKRFDADIMINKPTIACIKFGMNDVGRWDYGVQPETDKLLAARELSIEKHMMNTDTLIQKFEQLGVKTILISPTIFEENAKFVPDRLLGCNTALGKIAANVKELSVKYNIPFVDFYHPMNNINASYQEGDSMFSIVGPDRVHPGLTGNMVMCTEFLSAMHLPGIVAAATIDAKKQTSVNSLNCLIKNVHNTADSLTFEYLASSLPFPFEEGTDCDRMIDFTNRFNREMLTISGMPNGWYRLIIDSSSIGVFSNITIEDGINLARFRNTPQYKQAMVVKKIADARHEIISKKLRGVALVEFGYIPSLQTVNSFDEKVRLVKEQLAKDTDKSYYDWLQSQANIYLANMNRLEELKDSVQMLENQIYSANIPVIRKVQFIPVRF